MYDQSRPRLLRIPLEASEDGFVKLVICLMDGRVSCRLIEEQYLRRTFFLNCLYIASRASLIVTPLRFRAVTSRPNGKCRSIFLTGGVTRYFLRASLSSRLAGDVLSFLQEMPVNNAVPSSIHSSQPVWEHNGLSRKLIKPLRPDRTRITLTN